MRCAPFTLFALSSLPLLAESAPFLPQDGLLQRNRRRAVDYPVQPNEPQTSNKKVKRSVNYSVVQVDGGSSSSPSPSTIVQTVTDSASTLPPTTMTVVYTSVVQESQSQETIVVTTTQELSETLTTAATSANVTVVQTSVSDTTANPQTSVATQESMNTVTSVITATISATTLPASTVSATVPSPSSSTSYYDNGMWHTYYPVKNFVPPSAINSVPTTKQARDVYAAGPTPCSGAALPSEWAWKQHMKKRSAAGSSYGAYTTSFGAAYATPAVHARAVVAAQPSAHSYIKRSSNDTALPNAAFKIPASLTAQPVVETEYLLKRAEGVAEPTGYWYGKRVAGVAYPSGSWSNARQAAIPGVAQPTGWPARSPFRARGAPANLKLASWNITRTRV